MRIIIAIFLTLLTVETQASIYFITGEEGIKFSKQSYGCNDGWYLAGSKCVKNVCSSATYPLSIKPENSAGTVISCKSGDDITYGYSSCNNGWTMQSGNCVINNCDGFTYSSKPDTTAGTVISCKSGMDDLFAYSSCNNGWALSSGRCNQNACEGYPYSAKPDTTIGTVSSTTCKSGATTKYKYASCKTGWDLNNGTCAVHICDSSVYYNSYCPTNATCANCYTGGNIKYAAPFCNYGYEMSGGACIESCDRSIYSRSYCPSNANCSYCYSAGVYYYSQPNYCDYGYELLDGVCVEKCMYTETSAPSFSSKCSRYDSCVRDGTTYYGCTECSLGYYADNDHRCSPNYCGGYKTSGSNCQTAYGSFYSCWSADTMYCTYSSCNSGYNLKNGVCEEICGGYNLTSIIDTYKCKSYSSCIKNGKTYYKCNTCSGTCFTMGGTECVHIYEGEPNLTNIPSITGCKSDIGVLSHSCTFYDRLQFWEWSACKYSSCGPNHMLKDGMCWCAGNYSYNGVLYEYDFSGNSQNAFEERLYPDQIAASYTRCVDVVDHINVQSWKTIPTWTTMGSLSIYKLSTDEYKHYEGGTNILPIQMFIEFCKANGGHFITRSEIYSIISLLPTFNMSYPFNETIDGRYLTTMVRGEKANGSAIYMSVSRASGSSTYSEYNTGGYPYGSGYSGVTGYGTLICVKN